MRFSAYMWLLCPEFTLRDLQRCQCAARRCRAFALSCEKLRFDQWCTLGAPDVPCGPLVFRRATEGSRVPRKGRGVKRAGKPWCPCPFCLCRLGDPASPGRRRRHCARSPCVKVASSGAPLYRRNRLPSAEGKERRTLVASDGENQAFFACLRSTADFTISMPIRHTTPISTMVPPGFSPP